MAERHETVIVGDDHASLAMSHHLSRRGRPHVVLERGRLVERWRTGARVGHAAALERVPQSAPAPARRGAGGGVGRLGVLARTGLDAPPEGPIDRRHRSALAPIPTIDLADRRSPA